MDCREKYEKEKEEVMGRICCRLHINEKASRNLE